jgi:hypothetical protein
LAPAGGKTADRSPLRVSITHSLRAARDFVDRSHRQLMHESHDPLEQQDGVIDRALLLNAEHVGRSLVRIGELEPTSRVFAETAAARLAIDDVCALADLRVDRGENRAAVH